MKGIGLIIWWTLTILLVVGGATTDGTGLIIVGVFVVIGVLASAKYSQDKKS